MKSYSCLILLFSCSLNIAFGDVSKSNTNEILKYYVENTFEDSGYISKVQLLERNGIDTNNFSRDILSASVYSEYWNDALFMRNYIYREQPHVIADELQQFFLRDETIFSDKVIMSKIQCLSLFNSILIRYIYNPNIFGGKPVESILKEFAHAIIEEDLINVDVVNQKFGVTPTSSDRIKSRSKIVVDVCLQILYKMQVIDTNTNYLEIFERLSHSDNKYVSDCAKMHIERSTDAEMELYIKQLISISIQIDPILKMYRNVEMNNNSPVIENDNKTPNLFNN
jgi:hypothetical protein